MIPDPQKSVLSVGSRISVREKRAPNRLNAKFLTQSVYTKRYETEQLRKLEKLEKSGRRGRPPKGVKLLKKSAGPSDRKMGLKIKGLMVQEEREHRRRQLLKIRALKHGMGLKIPVNPIPMQIIEPLINNKGFQVR